MVDLNHARVARGRVARPLALGLLLILYAVLACGARQISFTFDEPSHITSGYAFLARGARWTIPERGHPLLADAWLALPFYLGDPDIPVESLSGWNEDYLQFVEAFAPFLTQEMERSEIVVRMPAVLLAMLLAAVVYRWGADLWGEWIGLLALGLLVFDPTLLAHGRLATNDVGVTALGTLGLYLIWRWARVPSWRRAAAAGFVMGTVMLAKASGLLWVAVGVTWATWASLRQHKEHAVAWLQALLIGTICFLMWWGMYGFEIGQIAGDRFPIAIPVPAPQHWMGVLFHAAPVHEHTVIALGKAHIMPWLWYFPLAFLIKNPLPLLAALLLAAGVAWHKRQYWRRTQILWFFSILYTVVAIDRGPNLGYRHMLPIHPLLYLAAASGLGWAWRCFPQFSRWGVVILSIWYIVGTLRNYPYNLAFFNELAGGPMNGWRFLSDSNTDWGQSWKALRTFREERGVSFSYSGPEGYAGVTPYELWNRPLPPLHHVAEPLPSPWLFPEPGDYVISGNSLSGVWLTDPDNYAWFRYRTPDAVVANTLYYYHVDGTLAPDWLAQCAVPKTPLHDNDIASGFEGVELRVTAFDCDQSWIYPGEGKTRGVYALHGAILRPDTLRERLHLAPAQPVSEFASRHLEPTRQTYRQWSYRSVPAFALYEWEMDQAPVPSSEVWVASVDAVPGTLLDGASVRAPLSLSGPLTFLGAIGYSQEHEGKALEVETWWQVDEGPITRPFSIMAHLLTKDGTVLGVADGLGAFPPMLAAEDIIVQRHLFPGSTAGPQIYLRTGAYWVDVMERWPVQDVSGGDTLFVPLDLP